MKPALQVWVGLRNKAANPTYLFVLINRNGLLCLS